MILSQPITRLLLQQRRFSIGRMIDMGGKPSGSTDNSFIRTVNASKNSKLQAVAFDFEALTKSIEESKDEMLQKSSSNGTTTSAKIGALPSTIQPDMEQIQQVASLLNVEVPSTSSSLNSEKPKFEMKKSEPHEDIRAKYAKKLQGGLAGIELAKSQVEETLTKGDAAGHLAAKKLALQTKGATPTAWMAMTGTGKLLSYLTHRSIKIALLPNPKADALQKDNEQQAMETLNQQLKGVVIDCIVRIDHHTELPKTLEKNLLDPLNVHPNSILVVTDRDDLLKAAKHLDMLTCRLQKPNTRRGNISAHFNAPSVPDVQEVVNEVNGVSFNAVLNR